MIQLVYEHSLMDIKRACDLGEELANKYNQAGTAPFPFEKILEDEPQLKILNSNVLSEKKLSGAILYEKEDSVPYTILVNSSESPKRQYFTIAHELGHYFLHKELLETDEIIIDEASLLGSPSLYRTDGTNSAVIEREANNFAASLIMPKDLVAKAWDELQDIEELAKIFKVSSVAMSIRLDRLGLVQ